MAEQINTYSGLTWVEPKFHTEYRCYKCYHHLSYNETMSSLGRCPYCGDKHEDACTIINTVELAYYLIPTGRWWEFWKPKRKIYKGHGRTD